MAVDTNDTSIRDRNLIIPVILLVILAILALLLRSLLAPVLLIATTVLSFGTALGVAALVFNHVLDFPGADPAVPLYSFVFVLIPAAAAASGALAASFCDISAVSPSGVSACSSPDAGTASSSGCSRAMVPGLGRFPPAVSA